MESILLDPSEITVTERGRQEFGEDAMQKLVQSIKEHGQLQNIGITPGKVLIWGERRLRACKELGIPVECTIKEADETRLMELEEEENERREDLTAKEKLLRFAQLHDHYEYIAKQEGTVWSLEDTAIRRGISKSMAYADYEAAIFLKAMDHLFEHCTTKTEIKSKVKALKEQMQHKRNQEKIETMRLDGVIPSNGVPYHQPKVVETEETMEVPDIEASPEQEERIKQALEMQRLTTIPVLSNEDMLTQKLVDFENRLGVGDAFTELSKLQDEIVDIMLLDPPWGVDIDEKAGDKGKLRGRVYADSKNAFTEFFPVLCRLCYEKMKPDSHLYCFFGIINFHFVYDCLEEAGFTVNRRPIMVCKANRTSTRTPNKWPGASYEPVAFVHKGYRSLVRKGEPDSFSLKWITPTEKKGHISAKPPEVYKNLLARSAHPNDFVCDPMYGSGAAFLACEMIPELNLQWFGWELDENSKSAALMSLTEFAIKGYGGGEE